MKLNRPPRPGRLCRPAPPARVPAAAPAARAARAPRRAGGSPASARRPWPPRAAPRPPAPWLAPRPGRRLHAGSWGVSRAHASVDTPRHKHGLEHGLWRRLGARRLRLGLRLGLGLGLGPWLVRRGTQRHCGRRARWPACLGARHWRKPRRACRGHRRLRGPRRRSRRWRRRRLLVRVGLCARQRSAAPRRTHHIHSGPRAPALCPRPSRLAAAQSHQSPAGSSRRPTAAA